MPRGVTHLGRTTATISGGDDVSTRGRDRRTHLHSDLPPPDPRFVAGRSSGRRGSGRPVGPGLSPVLVPRGARVLAPNDYRGMLARVDELGARPGIELGEIGVVQGHRVPVLRMVGEGDGPKLKVLITGGVHGNEPCSVAAAMLLLEQFAADPGALDGLDLTVVPCVNPRGFVANTRRTPEDIDLNRVFGTEDAPAEAKNLARYLEGRRYDLALDLHSGTKKRKGFWTLHRGGRDLLVPALARFAERWPVLRTARIYDITDPGVGVSQNRSTLKDYIFDGGTPHTVTVEAPASLDYLQMSLGENCLVHEILHELRDRAEHGVGQVG